MRWRTRVFGVVVICLGVSPSVDGHAPSGAIFTTLSDGSEVNVNQFPSKDAVYLDGGPGIGAPSTAAGLDDGTYVFQVTDPSGRTLLSSDPARCRQFTVSGGLISGVVDTDCDHATGADTDHGATTVQLFPFDDTPNPGGVYKVWVVRVDDFLNGCQALGQQGGLDVVDCGRSAGNLHGFVPAHTKTDNFKVKNVPIREIDAFFVDDTTGEPLSGRFVTWFDPLGASNKKWSYLVLPWMTVAAHVEAVEDGFHQLVISDQGGCAVGDIYWADYFDPKVGGYVGAGPQVVGTYIRNYNKQTSVIYTIHCRTQ
jgi:hypothetical protein